MGGIGDGKAPAPFTRLLTPLHLWRSAGGLDAGDLVELAARGTRAAQPVLTASWATGGRATPDRKSTRLNSSHIVISYAVFCLKKKKKSTTIFFFTKKKKKIRNNNRI